MRSKHVLGLTLLAAVLGNVRHAHATPLFEMVGGFGGQGALQARNAGPSVSSTYFNPALLPDAPAGLFAGVLVVNQDIAVRLDARPPGSDVPNVEAQNIRRPDGSTYPVHPISTQLLQNGRDPSEMKGELKARPRQGAGTGQQTYTYEAVGLVVKLLEGRVAFGLYSLLPNKNFTTFNTFFANEKEQYVSNSLHPELYSDRLTTVSVATAAGLRVTDTFNLGLGVTIALNALAGASAFVADANRLSDIDLDINAKARVKLVPHLGLSWKPDKRWHLTGTVHAPNKIDVDGKFQFVLASGNESGAGLAFTYGFQPWQVAAGLSFDLIQRKDLVLTATGSALYGRWSRYVDRQSIQPWGAYEWNDTITGAGGVRMEKGALSMALDGQYKPTPVPLQTGRSNYVDNDRIGLAMAVNYAFKMMKLNMKLGVMLQGYRLLERHQTKLETPTFADGVNRTPQLVVDEVPDNAVLNRQPVPGREGLQTNNTGYPGFSSVGWISSAGLYLTVML